jgi:hypothetical protein
MISSAGSFDRAAPIPDWLLPIKARAAAFAGLYDAALVQALLTHYDPGAGIGWHRDRPAFEHVVGISLGVPATLRFRRRRDAKFDRATAPLAARSIYHLSGEARHGWEHGIAGMDETRWSITLRSFSDKGLRAISDRARTDPAWLGPPASPVAFMGTCASDPALRRAIRGRESRAVRPDPRAACRPCREARRPSPPRSPAPRRERAVRR